MSLFDRNNTFCKKMKKKFLFFLIAINFSNAQSFEPIKIDAMIAPYEIFVGTDEYDVPYFLLNDVLIKKTNSQVFEYKNLLLGKISKIDLQNPLKIVLFYQDLNSIITLDNQLNETNLVQLSNNKTPILATAAGMSAKNIFWIFNSLSQKIGLFDYLSNEYQEITPPLKNMITFYNSDFNFFRWINAQNQLVTCDVFGKIESYTIQNQYDSIQIIENSKIIVRRKNQLFWVDVLNNVEKEIKIDEKTIENFSYKNQILTIFTNQKLSRYKINLQ